MKVLLELAIITFTLNILVSCNSNGNICKKMEEIKAIGDTNQNLAFAMLDSIKPDVRKADEHTRMKYDLLTIRINDKANIMPTSDFLSKQMTSYFESHGNDLEKQEAYYYNGSVYRDLQDAPSAIENFLMSVEIATLSDSRDSLLLRNAYSNLYSLFFNVQDYNNSLVYAKKEFQISKEINRMTLISIMHLGISYIYLGNDKEARQAFNLAFDYIKKNNNYEREDIYLLMMYLSNLGEKDKASFCHDLLRKQYREKPNASEYISLAKYFEANNATDSAIACYEQVIHGPSSIFNVYDAAKFLSKIYINEGDYEKALKYADLFIAASDSLDLGKRQELAASVNNQFMYHYDKHKEEVAKEKLMKSHYLSIIFVVLAILAVVSVIAIHIYLKNKNFRKTLALTKELNKINKELVDSKKKLKESEDALSEKQNQHETFIRLLHKTEFEINSEDVINAVRQSADGTKKMSPSEWRQLYQAVDELYPEFKKLIVQNIDSLTEQQMQLCYLMRIGLTKPQIKNITNIPHVTVWRWTKKFSWAYGSTGSL